MILVYLVLFLVIGLILFVGLSFLQFFIYKVPLVFISKKDIDFFLDNFNFDNNKKIVDLGCGDARFLLSARKKHNVEGLGYEINWFVYCLAKFKVLFRNNIEVRYKNFFKQSLPEANYYFVYLIPEILKKLKNKFKKEEKNNCILISYRFRLPGMTHQKLIENKKRKGCKFYIYYL